MENKDMKLKMMRKIECHLKTGVIIEFYQDDDDEYVQAVNHYERNKEQFLCLEYVNNPNDYLSVAYILKENIDYFFDTNIVVVQLPQDWTGTSGYLNDWYHLKEKEQ